jgi:23S rRNA pseudouridine2605 synthase
MIKHSWDPTAPDAHGQDEDSIEDGAPGGADGERVAKALARAGVASRRDVERLIEAGRIAINGKVLTTPAVKVAPGDILTVDGAVVSDAEPTRMWRYHKPIGLVTTHKDPHGRPTVFESLAMTAPGLPRVISVGRLDINSEGLLLLTNDGELTRALELPSTGWMRRYRARAHGRTDQARLDKLKDGITIEGVRYGPIEARLDKVKESRDGVSPANVWITVSLTEGKNREVRRVLEHLGLKVNRLIRLSYGPFQLGVLGAGQVEEIGPRVIREQLAGLIAPENMPVGDKVVAIHQVGIKPRRAPGQGTNADALVPPPPEAKPKRKAGWAKAKPKAPFKGRVKAKGANRGKTLIEPVSRARPGEAVRGAKPSAQAGEAGSANRNPRAQAGEAGSANRNPRAQAAEGGSANRNPRAQAAEGGSANRNPRAQAGEAGSAKRNPPAHAGRADSAAKTPPRPKGQFRKPPAGRPGGAGPGRLGPPRSR